MALDLNTIFEENKRNAILLAEIGAWLHMLGKFHKDFIDGNDKLASQIPEDLEQNNPSLYFLLTQPWTGQIWQNIGIAQLNADQLSISDFIKEHQKPNASYGFVRLMWDAHGRGSGIEKGLLYRFAPAQKKIVYCSTAFGFEKTSIDKTEIENKRRALYSEIQTQLDDLKNNNGKPSMGWRDFRQSFLSQISQIFSISIGDTRRPLNDITLFDQTVASVAFFKTSMAQILIDGWKEPASLTNNNKYHWCILRIGFNWIDFMTKSSKISDIEARKHLITPLLDEIKHLLETDFPLGYEIYRDEMWVAFIVPEIGGLLDAIIDNGMTFSEKISELSRKHFNLEANLHLFPISPATRNMQLFGNLIIEPVVDSVQDSKRLKAIQDLWSQPNKVCIICGLRPEGPNEKAISRNVCNICEQRRLERAKIWSNNFNKTIWIDEVADTNGRIALLVGHFSMNDWLTGALISSMVAFDPSNRLLKDTERNNKVYAFDYFQLIKDMQQGLLYPRQTLSGNTLPGNLILKSMLGSAIQFGDIYDLIVSDTDLSSPQKEAWRFALALIRQQPSQARLRRVWETTKHFWEDAGDFSKLRKGEQRLQITGKLNPNAPNGTIGLYHVYQLLLGNVKLSAVWDPKNQRFITASNLEYISQPQRLGKPVIEWLSHSAGQEIKIEEPTGYGSKNKEWGTITIKNVEPIPNSEYIPAIPILAEPRTFMALVPADKALDIVNDIKNKYEVEMGKVRNRLPVHLGVVFAEYKTPLRVVLDAGRRMLKQKSQSIDSWSVTKKEGASSNISLLPDHLKNDKHFSEYERLELSQDNRKAVWHVPLKMGDGSTPDEWYPYVFVQCDKDGKTPSERKRLFEAPCPWNKDLQDKAQPTWLVHASDIHEGDVIYFTPSTLDFQWLDTGGRRFEIAYDDKGCRLDMQRRPYMLDELVKFKKIWDTLSAHLTSSQIHALNELIETKRNDWKDSSATSGVFTQFCQDTIANIEWRKKKKEKENERVYPWGTDKKPPEKTWLEEWTSYAAVGLLSDVIELNMKILKKKPECEEKS